jgi:hypothetical protein
MKLISTGGLLSALPPDLNRHQPLVCFEKRHHIAITWIQATLLLLSGCVLQPEQYLPWGYKNEQVTNRNYPQNRREVTRKRCMANARLAFYHRAIRGRQRVSTT